MAALLGVNIPRGMAPDSYNCLESWTKKDAVARPWLLEQAANHALTVRTPRWKYIGMNPGSPVITWGPKIETGCADAPQLYEMNTPDERENVAAGHAQEVERLARLIAEVRAGKHTAEQHRDSFRVW